MNAAVECPHCRDVLPEHRLYCRRPSITPTAAAICWASSLWPAPSPRTVEVVEMREAGLTFAVIARFLGVSAGRANVIFRQHVRRTESNLRNWSQSKLDDQLRYATEALAEYGAAKTLVGIDMLLEGAR